jgi:uncharacterized protein (TIGR02266 family)
VTRTDKVLKLTLDVERPSDLLARHYPNGALGGLTLDGPLPGSLGAPCEVKVQIPSGHFKVLGRLAWARHQSARGLKECFGVDFVIEDEPARARLLQWAKEELSNATGRSTERFQAELPVTIAHDGKARKEQLFDLSAGGAFVRTGEPLPVGSLLRFELRPPRSLRTLKLKGRVAWVRASGPSAGMGIEFLYEDADQSTRLRKMLHKLVDDRGD